MQQITPCIWFDSTAEAAANFYVSVFKNSRVKQVTRYPEAAESVSGKAAGTAMTVTFDLNGQPFMALNGGAEFPLNEAVSFVISCESQAEVDEYWQKLTADGGQEGPCGWCKDKFGLSWQVVPTGMAEYLNNPDTAKANKAMAAMLKMKKIDLAGLKRASEE